MHLLLLLRLLRQLQHRTRALHLRRRLHHLQCRQLLQLRTGQHLLHLRARLHQGRRGLPRLLRQQLPHLRGRQLLLHLPGRLHSQRAGTVHPLQPPLPHLQLGRLLRHLLGPLQPPRQQRLLLLLPEPLLPLLQLPGRQHLPQLRHRLHPLGRTVCGQLCLRQLPRLLIHQQRGLHPLLPGVLHQHHHRHLRTVLGGSPVPELLRDQPGHLQQLQLRLLPHAGRSVPGLPLLLPLLPQRHHLRRAGLQQRAGAAEQQRQQPAGRLRPGLPHLLQRQPRLLRGLPGRLHAGQRHRDHPRSLRALHLGLRHLHLAQRLGLHQLLPRLLPEQRHLHHLQRQLPHLQPQHPRLLHGLPRQPGALPERQLRPPQQRGRLRTALLLLLGDEQQSVRLQHLLAGGHPPQRHLHPLPQQLRPVQRHQHRPLHQLPARLLLQHQRTGLPELPPGQLPELQPPGLHCLPQRVHGEPQHDLHAHLRAALRHLLLDRPDRLPLLHRRLHAQQRGHPELPGQPDLQHPADLQQLPLRLQHACRQRQLGGLRAVRLPLLSLQPQRHQQLHQLLPRQLPQWHHLRLLPQQLPQVQQPQLLLPVRQRLRPPAGRRPAVQHRAGQLRRRQRRAESPDLPALHRPLRHLHQLPHHLPQLPVGLPAVRQQVPLLQHHRHLGDLHPRQRPGLFLQRQLLHHRIGARQRSHRQPAGHHRQLHHLQLSDPQRPGDHLGSGRLRPGQQHPDLHQQLLLDPQHHQPRSGPVDRGQPQPAAPRRALKQQHQPHPGHRAAYPRRAYPSPYPVIIATIVIVICVRKRKNNLSEMERRVQMNTTVTAGSSSARKNDKEIELESRD
jgi:hypothetical protein